MVHASNVQKKYTEDTIINLPDLHIKKGEQQLLLGLSGSGKTTILHILAGLLKPTDGKVMIERTDIYQLPEMERDRFRGRHIGIVFQQLHLLPALTVMENVLLAQYMANKNQDEQHIRKLLKDLDIVDKASSYPQELSHGQAQRASIARAVVNGPGLLLADEPTSNLDDLRSERVLELLEMQAQKHDAALIIATHDQRIKDKFPSSITLEQLKPTVTQE